MPSKYLARSCTTSSLRIVTIDHYVPAQMFITWYNENVVSVYTDKKYILSRMFKKIKTEHKSASFSTLAIGEHWFNVTLSR